MIFDLEQTPTPPPVRKADVCVVGAGAVGIALTVELLRLGLRVLLLEGGGRETEERSQDPYRSEIVGLRHNGIHTGRFRVLGGTTTKWGGQILELDESDFDKRPWVQGSGWPFPKSTLTRYYQRALELEGVDQSTLADNGVWKEIGVEPPDLGSDFIPYFSRWCPEPNFARLHRKVLETDEKLAICLHANACSLIIGGDGESIQGIRCRALNGNEAVFQAERYVLCLGGIESSRFLLQPVENGAGSAVPPPWHRSSMVGRHYQDHIDSNCAEILDADPQRFHLYFDNVFSRGYKYHPKLKIAPGFARQHQILNIAATMAFKSDTDEIQDRIKQLAKHILRGRLRELRMSDPVYLAANLPIFAKQVYRYKVRHRAFNPKSAQVFLRVHCEQEPLSESRITLSENRDALGLFRARLDWKVSNTEMRTIRTFVETVRDAFAQSGLARLKIDPDLYADDGRFSSKLDDSNHHMGGTRMSASPRDGVLNPDLRLHFTSNCYVCSGSVFPSSGFSNPTHTVLALAVRLAEHLTAQPCERNHVIETAARVTR